MNPKVKKGLIVGLSVFAVLFAALLVLPFAFSGKIKTLAIEQVNKKLLAKVDFDDFSLSFIRHFPNASVRVGNLRIVGVEEFAKDTLISCEKVDLVLNLKSLFSNKGYEIKKLQFINSHVLAHVLVNGKANWSIMKKDTTQKQPDTTASSFNLKLKDFVIKNANVVYWDEQGKMKAELLNLNHTTSGDLTADSSLLVTHTTVEKINYIMDGIPYLSNADAELDADINANMNRMIFTFSKNASRLNAIPFSLTGWVKMLDNGYDMDLKLNADKVDFKAILSMIPAIYANSFEGVKAGGKVALTGFMKGSMIGDNYPAFDFKLTAVNGWFQYPKLPKKLENINIMAEISNPGKTLDATLIDISKFSFLMGGNPFTAQLRVAYPMSDPELLMRAIGKVNLGNIQELYPLSKGTRLSGILDMNLDLGGRMSYYEKNQYDKFKFGGSMTITGMIAKMSSLPQDITITKASMLFNNQYINLASLQVKIGRNDLSATGKLENFVAYALHKKTLKGQLNMQSTYFNVSDFMSPDNTKPAASSKLSVMVIPKNIDFTMTSDFKQLVYGKMNFTNAKGVVRVLDGDVKFQNMGVQAFGGNMALNGVYSTSNPKKPAVNFDLNINDAVFMEVFKQVETLQKIVPIFNNATGKFSTKFAFNSLLQNDMMPDMASFAGNGSFSTKSIGLSNVQVLTTLASTLKNPGLANPNVKDVALNFDIKDGKLNTKPFNVNVGGVKMNLGGSTGLDKTIAYAGNVQLPDKFNLGKFSTVNMKIGGTFSKPKVSLDLKGTLNTMVGDAKAKVATEVNKQVDAAKAKATDEVRKQKEAALKAAQDQADRIKSEAQKLSDKLIADAQSQGDQLVAKASNPITKKIAQVTAKKIMDEATKKAADINARADAEAQKVIQKAE
jgi:hypothetical protein